MARWMAVAVAGAVLLAGSTGERAPARPATERGPMLAFLHGQHSVTLARVDSATLRPLAGPRLNVGLDLAWSFSPDRSLLALGGELPSYVPSIRVVDVARTQQLGPRVELAPAGWVVATGWLGRDRLAALVSHVDTVLVSVDASQQNVVARRHFEGEWQQVGHARDGFVVLIAPEEKIGPPRLAVLRPSGDVDVVVLDRVLAGDERVPSTGGVEFRHRRPALAIDFERGRAYVVQVGGPVAEVDLATLSVSYHTLSRRTSLLARLGRWLQPGAHAKPPIEGPMRHARWLGGGLIAMSGGDYSLPRRARRTPRTVFTPTGVDVIDTRDWSIRTIVRRADSFRLAGDVVLATGSWWSSELEQVAPIGLAAVGLDGRERFRMYEGRRAYVVHADARRAYVDPQGPGTIDVIDVATGRVVERRKSVARPLSAEAMRPFG